MVKFVCVALFVGAHCGSAFVPTTSNAMSSRHPSAALNMIENDGENDGIKSTVAAVALGAMISASGLFGGGQMAFAASDGKYDGFADYAKENQMEQSDVGCFVEKCGDQTKNLFSNPRGIKGVTCLGRCKGEQTCATRCFAEFGSEDLNNWLSCTIEENQCVKMPKNIDNSAENVGYSSTVKNFDPTSLVGKWYKTNGLNPNYDMFDCQYNTFDAATKDASELDMGIFLRVKRPEEIGYVSSIILILYQGQCSFSRSMILTYLIPCGGFFFLYTLGEVTGKML